MIEITHRFLSNQFNKILKIRATCIRLIRVQLCVHINFSNEKKHNNFSSFSSHFFLLTNYKSY